MKKNEIVINDIVEFKNKKTATISEQNLWIIQQYYDDNLNCLSNDDYTIVNVYKKKITKVLKK